MGTYLVSEFWRTCRAVSTESRLQLLWLLFEADELCVKELAKGAEITESYASYQLKVLLLGGVVLFRRENMNVIYRAKADPRREQAVELLVALKKSWEQNMPLNSVAWQMTTFTHGRRIEIVRLLINGPLSFNELMKQSGMTSSALSRGLLKLESRRVVVWDGDLYRVTQPKGQLGTTLLNIVCRKDV